MLLMPLLLLLEVMYLMPSTPFICRSMMVVTPFSTVSASAPMYCAVTLICVGLISGYCAIGKVGMLTAPTSSRISAQTVANTGRLIK